MTAYLDHAATTPMLPAAIEALTAELGRTGNASSLHAAGRAARRTVEEAREQLAAALVARPSEVVLTAGGTEADNLAIKGLFWSRATRDPSRRRILVSGVEHHAVLDPAFWMAEHAGAEIVLLPVDAEGRLDLDALAAELESSGDAVALISVMWANNEVGTLQPLPEVVSLARRRGIPVHADAVQAVGQVPVDFAASGLDAMTISGHKIGGPLGVGALLARRGLDLTPVLHGGGQERGVRSGTLDTPAARGLRGRRRRRRPRPCRASRRVCPTCATTWSGACASAVPGAVLRGPDPTAPGSSPGRWPPRPGLPADVRRPARRPRFLIGSRRTPTSPSPAVRATPCCTCWTRPACSAPPARHARRGCRNPATSCSPWASRSTRRGAHCGSASAHTSTAADVDALLAALPDAVARAQAAGLASASLAGRGAGR